jgi:hypothetical protein
MGLMKSSLTDLTLSKQPKNENENEYRRNDTAAEFVCSSTSQTASQ